MPRQDTDTSSMSISRPDSDHRRRGTLHQLPGLGATGAAGGGAGPGGGTAPRRQVAVRQLGSGQWSMASGQWSVSLGPSAGQWSVVSGQWWSVVSVIRSVSWAVVNGQWSVVSGQWWSVVSVIRSVSWVVVAGRGRPVRRPSPVRCRPIKSSSSHCRSSTLYNARSRYSTYECKDFTLSRSRRTRSVFVFGLPAFTLLASRVCNELLTIIVGYFV